MVISMIEHGGCVTRHDFPEFDGWRNAGSFKGQNVNPPKVAALQILYIDVALCNIDDISEPC
jgi:hypothetical protein